MPSLETRRRRAVASSQKDVEFAYSSTQQQEENSFEIPAHLEEKNAKNSLLRLSANYPEAIITVGVLLLVFLYMVIFNGN